MHLPRFMRRVNRVFTNPLLGSVAWLVPPLAVIHHVGRVSARRYRTPVVAFPTATGFVVPMTYGRDVDWARNLVKAFRLAQPAHRRRCCRLSAPPPRRSIGAADGGSPRVRAGGDRPHAAAPHISAPR